MQFRQGDNTGLRMIGPGWRSAWTGKILGEDGPAMNLEATIEDIHHTIHAHPTLSEALAEADTAANEAIHI